MSLSVILTVRLIGKYMPIGTSQGFWLIWLFNGGFNDLHPNHHHIQMGRPHYVGYPGDSMGIIYGLCSSCTLMRGE